MTNKRYLITSALPYINGVKHLGNLVGSMLPADVYARYLRERGEDVLFICATDEHGTPAEIAAFEAGLSVPEYCHQQHDLQAKIYKSFGLTFDHFGRSSSAQNRNQTQYFAHELNRRGLIKVGDTEQYYSHTDGRFLPDRYVLGTCPRCGFDRARGDQCENCTSLLDPADLLNPRSALSGATDLEVRSTRHLYLRLSELAEVLVPWLKQSENRWPKLVSSIAWKWIREGLRDRSITRDLTWGVPVDWPGFEGKVFYVWFDAPVEYIGATQEWAEAQSGRNWERWWLDPDSVWYTQFMAKDNVPFHTITWPAVLLGVGGGWKLPDVIKGFNWLTYEDGKFSTSQHRGVFMDDALSLLPADYWRYYLIANAPEASDSNFSFASLASVCNSDLSGMLGNVVNRVLSYSARTFGETVPNDSAPGLPRSMEGEVEQLVRAIEEAYESLNFRKLGQALRSLWSYTNSYLDREEPWRLVNTDRPAAGKIMHRAMVLLHIVAVVSTPVIPTASAAILEALGTPTRDEWPRGQGVRWAQVAPGSRFDVPSILFPKIQDTDIERWTAQFSGG